MAPHSSEIVQQLAAQLRMHGWDAEGFEADVGQMTALAQGPFIRVKGHDSDPVQEWRRLQKSLLEFYGREGMIDLGQQIVPRRSGVFGDVIIQAQASEILDLLQPDEAAEMVKRISGEFLRWHQFLKRTTLSKS